MLKASEPGIQKYWSKKNVDRRIIFYGTPKLMFSGIEKKEVKLRFQQNVFETFVIADWSLDQTSASQINLTSLSNQVKPRVLWLDLAWVKSKSLWLGLARLDSSQNLSGVAWLGLTKASGCRRLHYPACEPKTWFSSLHYIKIIMKNKINA